MNKDFTASFEFEDGTETEVELTAEFTNGGFSHAFGYQPMPNELDGISFDDTGYTPAQAKQIQDAIDCSKFDDAAWETLND